MQNGNARILIAGAGGTLGLPVTRSLAAAAGLEVIGLTRSESKLRVLEGAGAKAVAADALDEKAVGDLIRRERPGVIVNLLTALPRGGALRPADLRPTNLLRREGSANLLRAALETGVRRVVAESFVAVVGRVESRDPLTEDDPLGAVDRGDTLEDTIRALRDLENQHLDAARKGQIETVVLRFGFFYGANVPSTESLIRNLVRGTMVAPSRTGTASWVHIEDAVSATADVVRHPRPAGLYHVCDNQPVSMLEALEIARRAFGAKRPKTVPGWILRWIAPTVSRMTSLHLALDNGRIRREMGWSPQYPDLRAGFEQIAGAPRV